MKINSLLELYESVLKWQSVFMPIMSAASMLTGLVVGIVLYQVFWVGIILASIGLGVLGEFFLIRKYLIKKINELKDKEDK